MRYVAAVAFAAVALLTAVLLSKDNKEPAPLDVYMHIDADTSARAQAVELVKQGLQQHANNQYKDAIASYDRAAARFPAIADWLAVFAASSASYLGDTTEVNRRLVAVDGQLRDFAWRSRVRGLGKSGNQTRALELARAATKEASASRREAAWSFIYELDPASLDAADRAAAGRAFITMGQTGRGLAELERAVTAGELPLSERANIRYEMGRAFFARGDYEEARKQLNRVPRDHRYADDALYLSGRAQYRDGDQSQSLKTFRAVAERYPRSSAATRALFLLGDLAQDAGNNAEAAAYFRRAANAPAKIAESGLALMRLGTMSYVREDYAAAARIFDEYRAKYPTGSYSDQATYWAAQSAQRLGQTAAAEKLLASLRAKSPISYYGMLARAEAGTPMLPEKLPAGPVRDTTIVTKVATGLDRWQILREVGWYEAASLELDRLQDFFKGQRSARYEIAEQLLRRGAPHAAIATGRDLLTGDMPDERLLKILYPMPFQNVIEREARANGVDPYFVAALIRQESRFNHNARSGAGAIGLMQVMPATGRALGRALGEPAVTPDRLTDPELNVKLGTRFLADMMRTYGKRADVVLVAYNAGPSRAARWRSFPEYGVENLFVERIPFDETRDYVKVVTLNAAIYRSLYSGAVAGETGGTEPKALQQD